MAIRSIHWQRLIHTNTNQNSSKQNSSKVTTILVQFFMNRSLRQGGSILEGIFYFVQFSKEWSKSIVFVNFIFPNLNFEWEDTENNIWDLTTVHLRIKKYLKSGSFFTADLSMQRKVFVKQIDWFFWYQSIHTWHIRQLF